MSAKRPAFIKLTELPVDSTSTIEVVHGQRRRFVVPVRRPLVLVSQIQRSGGTLITQLLDGHRRLHVHPSELHIGKPKWNWPDLDLSASAEDLFSLLREKGAREHSAAGYQKLSTAELQANPNSKNMIFPFVFVQGLQKEIFIGLMRRRPPKTQRDILDHYTTSYFNAWLDYGGIYKQKVKYWLAFVPRLFISMSNVELFFRDYSDGYLVVPVRDPVSWLASARAHASEYADINVATSLWSSSNENVLEARNRWPDRVILVRFEDLVAKTEGTIAALLSRLNLQPDDTSFTPTFNGMVIESDSSFGATTGIDKSALDRSDRLPWSDREEVRARTYVVYRQLEALCIRPYGRLRLKAMRFHKH